MNVIHRRYCRSGHWRHHLERLLPWATADIPLAGARVLEIGSGPGQTTDWLLPRCGSLSAVEIDTADAEALAARLPAVEVHGADATHLPFDSASFDVVVSFTMLHHVPTRSLQDQMLAEAARVLRPAGWLAGSDSRWGPLLPSRICGTRWCSSTRAASRSGLTVRGSVTQWSTGTVMPSASKP